MKKSTTIVVGAGVGAALTYFFDPTHGPRRRALLREEIQRARNVFQTATGKGATDVESPGHGRKAQAQSDRMQEPVDDTVLEERVRSAMGGVVSHPNTVKVGVAEGRVILSGPVLADDVPLLIDRVLGVRGVRDVISQLQVHKQPGDVPELQGAAPQRPRAGEWSPRARLAAGVTGAAVGAIGFGGRGLISKAIGLAGLALLGRAATNIELSRLTGIGARYRAVNVRKAVRIDAPVEHVFQTWSKFENFPNFMTHVREVRPLGEPPETGRWHWKVQGASGMEFEFDTSLTAYDEDRFLAWRSEPGALIQTAGQVRFIANEDGSTTAEVQLMYNPVAGAVGHVIAKLLGDDPKSLMDDDLMRMKSFIESRARPSGEAVAAVEQPAPPTHH